MRILIVEDDAACRTMMERTLACYGVVDCATNGTEASAMFKTALEANQPYDLLCLDIMMPQMDGHETLSYIRRLEEERRIDLGDGVKVIMITALGDSKNILNAFKEGCESYVIKPIQREKLLREIEKLGLILAKA